MKRNRFLAFTLAVLAHAGCGPNVRQVDCSEDPQSCAHLPMNKGPRIYVDPPFGLTFSCVLLGCNEQQTLRVENRGDQELVIPLVRLALDAPEAFSLNFEALEAGGAPKEASAPDPSYQIRLRKGDALLVHVTYAPSSVASVGTTVRIDSYDGREEYRSASIQRTDIPIEVRQLGTARSKLGSDTLSFGHVEVGASVTRFVEIENISTNAAVLGVTDIHMVDDTDVFTLELGWFGYANPGETIQIPVNFSPDVDDVFQGEVLIQTNDPNADTYRVELLGTSLLGAALQLVNPASGNFEFGNVTLGDDYSTTVRVRNIGSDALSLMAVLTGAGAYSLSGAVTASLQPLEQADFPVELHVGQGGALNALLSVYEMSGSLLNTVVLQAYGVAPSAQVTPSSLAFGNLVQGWSSPSLSVKITNEGTGPMSISHVEFETGTSNQFHVESLPALPMNVGEGEYFEFFVRAQANYLGAASGAVLVHTDSVHNEIIRVPISVNVQTCEQGCPIANGQPSCGGGSCGVASCDSGFHNTDGNINTGCECMEERSGNDIGATCSTGLNVGTLGDKCTNYPAESIRTGNLHDQNDIDLYYFRTVDGSGAFCDVFSDSSRTSVELVSAPPGLALCVTIREPGSGCGGYTHYYDPAFCGQTYYEHDGKWGADDDKDVTAWVMWTPGAAPVCEDYVLKFRGRR